MPCKIQIEPFERCMLELQPLFDEAHAELGQFKAGMPLAPDYARYVALDRTGVLFVTTIRADGTLIGYMITSITIGLHHICNRIAVMDIAYVRAKERGRGYFVRMIKFVEEHLRELGVDLWICHYVTRNSLGFDRVLDRLGFIPTEQHVGKWLGNGT